MYWAVVLNKVGQICEWIELATPTGCWVVMTGRGIYWLAIQRNLLAKSYDHSVKVEKMGVILRIGFLLATLARLSLFSSWSISFDDQQSCPIPMLQPSHILSLFWVIVHHSKFSARMTDNSSAAMATISQKPDTGFKKHQHNFKMMDQNVGC